MNTTTHPIAPEEVMAYLDGELTPSEAHAVSAHLEDCAECAKLAEQFRATSQSLAQWTVLPAPLSLEDSVKALTAKDASASRPSKPGRSIEVRLWSWRQWALGAGGTLAAVFVLLAATSAIWFYSSQPLLEKRAQVSEPKARIDAFLKAPGTMKSEQLQAASAGVARIAGKGMPEPSQRIVAGNASEFSAPPPPPRQSAPMIARTVSLSIVVKDIAASRASLENVLARYHGYAAQLTVATPENAPRSFQASFRIPAQELAAALADLKALGRVENESQSGEEVTQQHADLAARLQNSRETEERLRAILQQRTGKIEDVLQVEEEIARVRGEIETMEAEQQALEHRVDFATVDLQLAEEYKEQLNLPSASVANRIHNAFVAGLRNAAAMLLGIFLFFAEYGPVLLIWLVILGVPAFFLWRRYRRVQTKL
jgi:hypothetical protein